VLKTVEIDNIICNCCKGKKVTLIENKISICPVCKGTGKAAKGELTENNDNNKRLILG